MIQKDYILRMIEQLGKVLARVLLKKNAQKHEEATLDIEKASGAILGIDFSLLDTLSSPAIAELLGISIAPSTGSMKCLIAGRLLKEKADILKLSGKDSASTIQYYQKSLYLYLKGMPTMGYTELDTTEWRNDIRILADILGDSISGDLMIMMRRL
ncbi:MAG: hypothetical protein GF401_16785 [Chitinivibrionales bacterium]|nr:hypothetical protein [Chitinivibrionales bacterium]